MIGALASRSLGVDGPMADSRVVGAPGPDHAAMLSSAALARAREIAMRSAQQRATSPDEARDRWLTFRHRCTAVQRFPDLDAADRRWFDEPLTVIVIAKPFLARAG